MNRRAFILGLGALAFAPVPALAATNPVNVITTIQPVTIPDGTLQIPLTVAVGLPDGSPLMCAGGRITAGVPGHVPSITLTLTDGLATGTLVCSNPLAPGSYTLQAYMHEMGDSADRTYTDPKGGTATLTVTSLQ